MVTNLKKQFEALGLQIEVPKGYSKAAGKKRAVTTTTPLVEVNPPQSARKYSSVKDFDDGYSKKGMVDSCLDSATGWTAARSELTGEPWVQMDAGATVQLGGVVVQSWQGWSIHGVSEVRVETSTDGWRWNAVEGGRKWGTPARKNARNKIEFGQVACRYVRVYGTDFSDRRGNGTKLGHGASMRCGLLVTQGSASRCAWPAARENQNRGGHLANNTYKLAPAALTWQHHDDDAKREGGTLACITSEEENEAVRKVAGGRSVWLGAIKHSSKWRKGPGGIILCFACCSLALFCRPRAFC